MTVSGAQKKQIEEGKSKKRGRVDNTDDAGEELEEEEEDSEDGDEREKRGDKKSKIAVDDGECSRVNLFYNRAVGKLTIFFWTIRCYGRRFR